MLLKIEEVAKEFRVSQRTVKRWIKAGKISVVRLSAGTIRIEEEEVAKLKRQG